MYKAWCRVELLSATLEVKCAGTVNADFMERLAVEESLNVQGIFLKQIEIESEEETFPVMRTVCVSGKGLES